LAPSNKKSAIHVLHVDDDPLLREITKLMLLDLDSNFKIDNASSVDESLKKLSTGHYDVVVSDYEMPQKDGLQFLKELREQNNDIPFILFTGKGREEVVVKALNMGADGYINKQGNPETVYGELEHIILTSFEKRNTQKLLWESEERFKKLVTNSKDAIMLTQADGIIRYLSPASKNVLGYEPSELIGKVPWIIHPDDLQRVQTVFQLALSSKVSKTLEYRILTKQGETKWVSHAFSQILENGKPTQIVSNLTDITERKKAEEAIIQSETHYRLLADNIRDVIWEMDLEGHFTYVSPSAIHLSGYTPDEAIKQSIVEVLTPESARIVLEDLQRFRETGTFPSKYYELEEYCKDGSTVWIGVNFSVLRKRDGEPKSFLGVSRNITERKIAEEALNVVMVQLVSVNEKLGVVGSLTRHDVRNKLSAVTGYAYLLKKKYADQADIVEGLGKMEQAVKDSMKIFEFAKMYEQLGIEELKHIDVEKTVNEAFTLFSGFALKVVNDCYGLRVLADSFLRQLFYNFMDNTIKYGKKAATVRVYYETSVSGDLNLIYEDDGVGISTENKSKLFSEGFSTGGSTGFGLFLIKKMMGIYGWTITETGEVDKGVRFVIAIPKHNMQGKENYQIT
jgi:PAS domain S-box-containing protein